MDLMPVTATKPDSSPAGFPEPVEGETGFDDLVDALLVGVNTVSGNRPGPDEGDVEPDDRHDSDGSRPPEPVPPTTTPANGSTRVPARTPNLFAPEPYVPGSPMPVMFGLDVSAAERSDTDHPTSPSRGDGATSEIRSPSLRQALPVLASGPPTHTAPTTDAMPKAVPAPVSDIDIPAPDSAAPKSAAPLRLEDLADQAPETTQSVAAVGHERARPEQIARGISGDGDDIAPATADVATRRPGTADPDPEPVPPTNRIGPETGSPTSAEGPEAQVARAAPPSQGTARPGMAALVDQIREWADHVESTQRTDAISLKLADPEGELHVRLVMRDGRLDLNVTRPGGDIPSWLLDQLDDALTRRGFDMARDGERRHRDDPDSMPDRDRRPPETKRERDGFWM